MTASINLSFSKAPKAKSDTVVLFAIEGGKLTQSAIAFDQKSGGMISQAVKTRNYQGKHGDLLSVFLPEKAGFAQALIAGLGDIETLDNTGWENAGGKIFAALKSISAQSVTVLVDAGKGPVKEQDAAASLAFGMSLRNYTFDKYKQNNKTDKNGDGIKKSLKDIVFVTAQASAAQKIFTGYEAVARGVVFARDLVNEAPNALYPESYSALLKKELTPLGVQVEILDEKRMEKLGFGAHLAVGMGSARPPRVVIMRWNGLGTSKSKIASAPVAFVGKGVTFDTGGISIKPAAGMEEMKMDMGGSAAVAGLMRALAQRKAKTHVVGIVGLAENMPSDRAYRPGDIITSLSGKTIEVLNTDAEGRLVLADALTYVQQTYKPRMIVDLATLTGAIMVALGYEYAGAFVNDDKLWTQLESASKQTGEKLWRMPLDEAFREEMKNSVSDLRNLGNQGRYGGACSAAGFLEHFIEDKTPWAHLDIAGTAWWKSDKPTVPKGGSGFGVRLLNALVADHYES